MKVDTGALPVDEPEPKGTQRLWTVVAALPYLVPVGLLLVLAAAITLIAVGAYTREWKWTGFLSKTLWDWMKLLIVPIILALGGLLITQMDRLNSARAQQLDKERLELDSMQTRERIELDRMQTREQLDIARRGQITERFSQAIEQLGKTEDGRPILEIRLGGIYSLERIAYEDRDYHWPIMEVLTTYVRANAFRRPEMDEEVVVQPNLDIQAILTVIGRRSRLHKDVEHGSIDLRDTDLTGADLREADLRGAVLNGAVLRGADFRGANLLEANFREAFLEGANFEGTYLRVVSLQGADLRGVNLQVADPQGAFLEGTNLRGANLRGADLQHATLRGADLQGARLENANLKASIMPNGQKYEDWLKSKSSGADGKYGSIS